MLDKRLKESADKFIEATKKDPELMKQYKDMLYKMDTFAVAYVYTGAAMIIRRINDNTSLEQAQKMVKEDVQKVEDYLVDYLESNNIDHSTALLAFISILVRLIPSQSLEMVRYMYDELSKQ